MSYVSYMKFFYESLKMTWIVFINVSQNLKNGKSELQNCLKLLRKLLEIVFINFSTNCHECMRTENSA